MSAKTIAIIQARMTSSRLPGKVLKPLAGAPMIRRMLERVERIQGLDAICLALPESAEHDPIAKAAPDGVEIFRGDEHDVLDRTYGAARQMEAGIVMRMTSDCPLIDPEVSSAVLAAFLHSDVAYARTAFASGYPHGFDTEVFSQAALATAHKEARAPDEREHVTPFIWRRPERFPALELDYRPDRRHWRLTVDTQEDYDLAREIYDRLHTGNPAFGLDALERLFAAEPALLDINRNIVQPKLAGMPGTGS